MHTEDELFAKGRAAVVSMIEAARKETKRQLDHLRDHYETGHGGTHSIPEGNSPLDCLYKVLGDQMLDMQFLRQMDPERFGRLELVYWINSALIFSTVKPHTPWKEFHEEVTKGVDKFFDRQMRDLDKPVSRDLIAKTGHMIAQAEVLSGRKFEELQ